MRNVLVLGSLLCALLVAGCDGAFVADLKCGKDGKVKGEIELILIGEEYTQEDLDEASCEDLKELKSALKSIKVAVGKDCNDEFKPIVYSKKGEIEDENCDGYLDISFEFNVKKLVCEGLLDKDTSSLLVGFYVKDEDTCEWQLEEVQEYKIVTEEEWNEIFGCEEECEDDCEKDCDKDESEKDCEKKEEKKDCNNQQPT